MPHFNEYIQKEIEDLNTTLRKQNKLLKETIKLL
jgi:hypothetical protein